MELVKCKRCLSIVSEIGINREEQVAHCQHCGALFSLNKLFDTASEEDLKPIRQYKSHKPEIHEMPFGLDVMHYGFELNISSKSNGVAKHMLTFFSLFWNGIVAIFVITAFLTKDLTMLLFISAHLAIGLAFGYYTLSLYINKNEIIVDKQGLQMKHGPLKFPFKKDKYIDSKLINQIYCQKYVIATVNGNPNYGYKVILRKNDSEVIDIMKDLSNYHQALYLEQQIESFLGLKDQEVAEEFRMS